MEAASAFYDEGATYAEARLWAQWLQHFFLEELAKQMFCSVQRARELCADMEGYRVIRRGGVFDGEVFYAYVPPPPGPRSRPKRLPPEVTTEGCYSLAPRRGYPVGGTSGHGTRKSRKVQRSKVG